MTRRYKILLVDDDRGLLEELSEALAAAGYEVESFTDGRAALEAAAADRPDIALVDLKMQGLDGFRTAEALSRLEPGPPVPVVAMTGYYTRREDESRMKASGIRACLFKPFPAETAARKLHTVLQGERR